jgi:catechol 2,3-dioxygenase-like lactoylglutathione lyase family enzyme
MLKNTRAFSSFSVDNIDKAKDFYTQILGLDVSEIIVGPSYHLLELQLTRDNKVMLYPKENHIPATFTVLNFVVTNVEQTVEELTQAGVTFEIYDTPDLKTNEKGIVSNQGPKVAWFKDPAGNILAVMEEQ